MQFDQLKKNKNNTNKYEYNKNSFIKICNELSE